MKVSPLEPFQIIYSIYQHEYLGYLFESYVVQCNATGKLTLQHQNISSKNAREFSAGLDDADYELIRWMDSLQQDEVARKFSGKKTNPGDFFLKVFDKDKGDRLVQEAIEHHIEHLKAKILQKLKGKLLFETGTDGEPTYRAIQMAEQEATVWFHFMRNETNTHYFPTIQYKGVKVEFNGKGAIVLCNRPAWLLCEGVLYHFAHEIEGNKLKPFVRKKFVDIPKKLEEEYYRKFISQIIASFDVFAKGFEIINCEEKPSVHILFTCFAQVAGVQERLFDSVNTATSTNGGTVLLDIRFCYGEFSFTAQLLSPHHVHLSYSSDRVQFYKVKRHTDWEKRQLDLLKQLGLTIRNGKSSLPLYEGISWIEQHKEALEAANVVIEQKEGEGKRYYLGERSMEVSIYERQDWFDLQVKVVFGSFEIPFFKIRDHIVQGKREFVLPDGTVACIPEAWFTRYLELASFSELQNGNVILHKHHFAVVDQLHQSELANVTMQRKLEGLRSFEQIDDKPLSFTFKGELRPYQKAGYNWMQFLREYKLGGCLADDMGLGKTIQTLALLADLYTQSGGATASLLVMPTSLLYNWEAEARKFTPDLRILVHSGTTRARSTERFDSYDLILTSYGILRMDVEWMEKFAFHYVILDESQAIKNPSSAIAQAVRKLHAEHRLILTGTPLENSVLDIWSQMHFINPGLLGSASFFKKHFKVPIEKNRDESSLRKLQALIKPFILRRHKSQVATELPDKIENLTFCTMTKAQTEAYEKAKAYYRNQILSRIEQSGLEGSQIFLLQGLSVLRQMANHPAMVDAAYTEDSGKLEDAIYKIESILENNHKILIFSSYVKHLTIIRASIKAKSIPHYYLDGHSKDRMSLVQAFQWHEGACVFLMSMKAGGVGLNLTAAEYVFIMDPWWNPASEAQAIDRAHRIGQSKTVVTYKFISKDTIEEKILNLQKHKLQLANELISVEESFTKALTLEDIEMLLE